MVNRERQLEISTMNKQDVLLRTLLRYESPARLVAELVLLVALALVIGRLVWLVLAPAHSVAALDDRHAFPAMIGVSGDSQTLTADRTLLMRENPFASSGPTQAVPDAPETTLNLTLSGLFMSSLENAGSAIIRGPDGRTNRYSVGDTVLQGVTLDRILSDRVIILRNGNAEALMMSGRIEGLSVIGDGSQVTVVGEPSSAPPSEPSVGVIADPALLLSGIRYSVVQRDGQPYGLQVSPAGDPSILQRAGLLPGDVITRINGSVPDAEELSLLLADLSSEDEIELDIERRNIGQSLRIRIGE